MKAGDTLGNYRILDKLGEGGMGEVYRALDTNLGRAVAIKVLPEALADDADRLARFDREARTLATLNHPNIAQVHGLEKSGGTIALVMELVDGPTLADRLVHGAIPVGEALTIARQIAEALEAAHAQGIVHRDLKPANVKARPDGRVKVLDFGLAKAIESSPAAAAHGQSMSPTITTPAMPFDFRSAHHDPSTHSGSPRAGPRGEQGRVVTLAGVILGTAAYMSPEQARGSTVDSRADIWAFGVMLFEMLSGKPAFQGDTVPDTLAAVLRAEFEWHALPRDLPASVFRLLRRCLQRDVKKRLQHIGDARIEIEDLESGALEVPGPVQPRRRWRLALLSAVCGAAVVGSGVWFLRPGPQLGGAPIRFVIQTPYPVGGARMSSLALSPDGRQLVYVATVDGKRELIHQSLDAFAPRILEGAEGAVNPFFSPRGDVVGFLDRSVGQLRRVGLSGGNPVRLADVTNSTGASWSADNTLVFAFNWGQPLRVLRPSASAPEELTQFDTAAHEGAHLWPQVLPGGRDVLFSVWTGAPTWDEGEVAIADLRTGQHTIVLRGGTSARYAASGHIIFWRGNALQAAPFDLATLQVTGDAVAVVPDVRLDLFSGSAHFALSENGTLAFVPGSSDSFTESYVADRSGRVMTRLDDQGPSGNPAFSPDGTKVALTLFNGGTFGIGVYDVARRLLTRLPLTGDNEWPSWSPSGDRVTFQSTADGQYRHYTSRFDGSSKAEPLFPDVQGFAQSRGAWSPDRQHFVYPKPGNDSGSDLWMYTPGEKATTVALIATAANESDPAFSPDGRFIAYRSDESGRAEVWVRPFPDVGSGRALISRNGGSNPVWTRSGREIVYATDQGLVSVPVTRTGTSVSSGEPSLVLRVSGVTSFDVSPDGQTFAIERTPLEKSAHAIHVIVNWFDELRRLVPAK